MRPQREHADHQHRADQQRRDDEHAPAHPRRAVASVDRSDVADSDVIEPGFGFQVTVSSSTDPVALVTPAGKVIFSSTSEWSAGTVRRSTEPVK
ncbi:hypothetical protein GCM10018954_043270 [Kutzneria kofuensis]